MRRTVSVLAILAVAAVSPDVVGADKLDFSGAAKAALDIPDETATVAPRPVDTNRVAKLVEQLGHAKHSDREQADMELRTLSANIKGLLQNHLAASDDPEISHRLRGIIAQPPPPLTLEMLKAVVIPVVEFRQAAVTDCCAFLEDAAAELWPADGEVGARRIRIVVDMGNQLGRVPTVTFAARDISLYEALRVIGKLSNLQLRIQGNKVVLSPKAHVIEVIKDPFADPDIEIIFD